MKAFSVVICLFFNMVIAMTGAFAETVYLKDGTLVRGKITREDENSLVIENRDTWRRVEKSSVDFIKPDEQQAEQGKVAGEGNEQAGQQQNRRTQTEVEKESGRRTSQILYFVVQVPINIIGGDFDGQRAPGTCESGDRIRHHFWCQYCSDLCIRNRLVGQQS